MIRRSRDRKEKAKISFDASRRRSVGSARCRPPRSRGPRSRPRRRRATRAPRASSRVPPGRPPTALRSAVARGAGGRGERDVRRPGVRPGEVQLARGRPERHPVRAPPGRVPRGETPRAKTEPLLHEIIVSGYHRRPHAPLPQPHVRQRGRPRAAQVHGVRVRRVAGSDAESDRPPPNTATADRGPVFPFRPTTRKRFFEGALFAPSPRECSHFTARAKTKTSGTRR